MFKKTKLRTASLVIIALVTLLALAPANGSQAAAAQDAQLQVQLIADSLNVGAGGTVKLHIIYHNTQDITLASALFKLNLSSSLDIGNITGAQWDAASQTMMWQLQNIQPGEAKVIDSEVKVKADAALGADLPISLAVLVDGTIALTDKLQLHVGPQIDQPFFVGYPDSKFHPERNLTRAETAAVIARIMGLQDDPAQDVAYSDVSSNHWAYGYIRKVTEAGYMSGYNGKFRPDDAITRAELVSLMLRIRGINPVPLDPYSDMSTHWAKDIVGTARALNYLSAIALDSFQPNQSIRRDEAANLISISLYRGPMVDGDTKVIQHFPDVAPDSPLFGWIEESAKVAHESVNMGDGEHLIRYLPNQTRPL